MTLEEALAEIDRLKGDLKTKDTEIDGLKQNAGKALSDEEIKKIEQKAYNQGFDKAKNAKEDEIKNSYVKKEDVDKMLSERDAKAKQIDTLRGLGVKNPSRAMKLIDEEDLKAFGTEDFDAEKFTSKYADDIVFTGGDKKEDPKKTPSNFMKNNKDAKEELTAEKFEAMTAEERSKLSTAEKLALL